MESTSDSTFVQDVLQSNIPVLVDFWAPWCRPCLMQAPILEEISVKYKDSIKILKLNVEENPNTASEYDVKSIPTLKIFKNGVEVKTNVGLMTKQLLEEFIKLD